MAPMKQIFTGFLIGFPSGVVTYKVILNLRQRKNERIRYLIGDSVTDEHLLKIGEEIFKYGAPQSAPPHQFYKNFVLHYDQERKIPKWVAEHITADKITGPAHRSHSRFRSDHSLHEMFRAHNSDFLNSGWSRGHMAPAGNNKYDQEAMDDTFRLSNVLPQNLDNNAGYWNRFEIYCRDLTAKYRDVYVISGPVMMPKAIGDNDHKFVHYNLIGRSEVAVPTHLYKVVLAEHKIDAPHEPPAVGAFIIPNQRIINDVPLAEFKVPMETLEKRVGLTMHPALDRDTTVDLCKVEGCKMKSWEEFELYMLERKINSANTLAKLDKYLEEAKRKRLIFNEDVRKTYKRKKQELEQLQDLSKQGTE